jgi:hypothetical protein
VLKTAFPAAAFANRLRGRPRQYRHGEEPGADDTKREQQESELAGDRLESFGGIRRGLDATMAGRR